MLYNKELKRPKQDADCLVCEHFNKTLKKCEGYGKSCYPYDDITKTCFDPLTNLPINFKEN